MSTDKPQSQPEKLFHWDGHSLSEVAPSSERAAAEKPTLLQDLVKMQELMKPEEPNGPPPRTARAKLAKWWEEHAAEVINAGLYGNDSTHGEFKPDELAAIVPVDFRQEFIKRETDYLAKKMHAAVMKAKGFGGTMARIYQKAMESDRSRDERTSNGVRERRLNIEHIADTTNEDWEPDKARLMRAFPRLKFLDSYDGVSVNVRGRWIKFCWEQEFEQIAKTILAAYATKPEQEEHVFFFNHITNRHFIRTALQ